MGRGRRPLDKSRYGHQLADAIRLRREQLGLSVDEVAARIGIATSTLYGWENGRSQIDWDLLPKVARALRCKLVEPGQLLTPKD